MFFLLNCICFLLSLCFKLFLLIHINNGCVQADQVPERNRQKWAKKYKKIIEARDSSGNVINQDKEGYEDCKVEVKEITGENAHMITIIMTRKDGKKIQISKRINK